jgi:hypothetical protein
MEVGTDALIEKVNQFASDRAGGHQRSRQLTQSQSSEHCFFMAYLTDNTSQKLLFVSTALRSIGFEPSSTRLSPITQDSDFRFGGCVVHLRDLH